MEVVQNYTDSALVDLLRSGKDIAPGLRFLYRYHYEAIKVYVLQNNGSEQDAEDLFQEVVLSFVELVQLGRFRGESSIKTFLYALSRNVWLNELKRKGRADARELKYEKARDTEEADTSVAMAGRESRKQVMDIITKLGESCKKILLAFYYEDKSMKEILEESEFENEQVVRNKKYKCLKQLEKMLHENPDLAKTLKSSLNYE